MEKLGSLVIGLSEDINSLDAEDVLDIQSFSIGTPFSDREEENLLFIKSTLLSYITQIGAELSFGQSALQDLGQNMEASQLPFCLTCSPVGTGELPYKLPPREKGQLPYRLTPRETGQIPYQLNSSQETGQIPYRLNSSQETGQIPYQLNSSQE